jgi:hypothetical protein
MHQQKICNWEDLVTIAKEARIDFEVEPTLAKLREENQKVQRKMKQLGVKKLIKFPGQGAAIARTLGRLADIVGHKMYSLEAHSAVLSPVNIGLKKGEDNENYFYLRDKNPNLVYGASHSAAEYLFEATIAIASWQEWSTLEKVKTIYQTIDAKFKNLATP